MAVEMVSVRDVAKRLGVGLTTAKVHVLPHLRVVRIGRRVLVPADELARWIEKQAGVRRESGTRVDA